MVLLLSVFLLMGVLPPGAGASENTPERFFLGFHDAYLVYVPDSGTLQIATVGNVISYGGDWEVRKLKPYLYHMRLRTWRDFFWKVNTSRKSVWQVTGGTFGQLNGSDTEKDFRVDVVGGEGEGTPDRFFIRFPKAYLIYVPGTGTLQIIVRGNVLSYGLGWQVKELKPYLYHMKLDTWQGFYWKINTNRGGVWRIKNGTFGQVGGTETELNITVRVEDPCT